MAAALTPTHEVPGGMSRWRARAVLAGDDAVPLDEARRHHLHAVALGDAEAVALWARVVWRILGRQREHQWLHQPVGYYRGRL